MLQVKYMRLKCSPYQSDIYLWVYYYRNMRSNDIKFTAARDTEQRIYVDRKKSYTYLVSITFISLVCQHSQINNWSYYALIL